MLLDLKLLILKRRMVNQNLGGSKGLKLGGVWKGLPSKSVKTTFKQPNLFKKAPKLSIKKNPMKFKPSNPFSSGGKKKKKFKLF